MQFSTLATKWSGEKNVSHSYIKLALKSTTATENLVSCTVAGIRVNCAYCNEVDQLEELLLRKYSQRALVSKLL